MDDEKTVNLFYNSVNKKQEPYVCSQWVAKINHKGQKDQRFFIATFSQLYLCKKSVFGGSISISRQYPWVSLKSITQVEKHRLAFEFVEDKITIETKKIDAICKELSILFYELFPQEFRAHFDLPLKKQFIPPATIRQMFPSLFVSACYALDVSFNENFFKKLSKSLKKHPKILDFTEIPLDKKMCKALLMSLELTQNIRYLVIPETKYFPLFESLIRLVKANRDLEGIELIDVTKTTGFEQFLDAIEGSSIVSLRFSKFHFTQQNFGYLVYSNQSSVLQDLEFSECDIDEKKMTFFMKLSDRFEKLSSFALNHDFNTITQGVLRNMKRFLFNSCITTIELRNANINIRDFFLAISGQELSLQKIDLSLNIFTSITDPKTKTIKDTFTFPPTLNELIISKVRWETDSLVYMLSQQKFVSMCTVDFSNLTLFNDDWDHFYAMLEKGPEPTSPPTSILWKNNKLDGKFIMFLTKMHQLTSIDLSGSYYEDDKMVFILNSLVVLVQTLNLRKFYFAGSKKCSHAQVICELLPVMTTRNTIFLLDVSDNALGNQGLEVLQRYVEQSPQLEELYFDGALPTQVQPYMNLLKSLGQSPSLTMINTTKSDIQRLIQMFPESKESLLNAWTLASRHVNENRNDVNEFADSALFTSFVEQLPAQQTKITDEQLDTSWALEFNLPTNPGEKEWEAMQKKYSLLNLISTS